MKELITHDLCGIDVYKDSIFMFIIKENIDKIEEKFGVLTHEVDRFRNLLLYHLIGDVVMESTSLYWIPIWYVFKVNLVNACFIKQLPSRKTGVKNANWIATVLQRS